MAEHGGAREGAGRKPGQFNKSTMEVKELLDTTVDFTKVAGKLYELSQGIELAKETAEGIVVYSKPPDAFASKILMEYRFGKAPQSIDVTSGGESLAITRTIIGTPPDVHPPTE